MSRSFTTRPAATNTRGRGRGTQTRNMNPMDPMTEDRDTRPRVAAGDSVRGTTIAGVPGQAQQNNNPQVSQRMTHQGAYTMITPNERKRQQVAEMARKEKENYEAFKEKNTQKSFSYVGTVGGGQVTQAESRHQTVKNSPTKTGKLLERQERKSFVKQKEDEEIQKKREVQRLKAIQNEEKRSRDVKESANKWDDQRKRTNEAFLRRLENKSKASVAGPPNKEDGKASQRNPSTDQSNSSSSVIGDTSLETPSTLDTPSASSVRGPCNEYAISSDEYATGGASNANGLTDEEQKRLNALSMIFPYIEESVLIDILQQVGFSVDMAITLLSPVC